MNRKYMALLLVALLLPCCIAVPARAAEADNFGWIDLLDYSSVTDTGNSFGFVGSGSVVLDSPLDSVYYYADILVQYNMFYGIDVPTISIANIYGDSVTLSGVPLGNGIYRYSGNLIEFSYSSLPLNFSGTSGYTYTATVLSCRLSNLRKNFFDTSASGILTYAGGEAVYSITSEGESVNATPVLRSDMDEDWFHSYTYIDNWQSFDYVDITFHTICESISAINVTMGSSIVPFEASYLNGGEYIAESFVYTVRVDLTSVDRSSEYKPVVYVGGLLLEGANIHGIMMVSGEVLVTFIEPEVSWLQKIKNSIDGFWKDVGAWFSGVTDTIATWGQNIVNAFSPDTGAADQVVNDAVSKGDQIGGLNDQMGSMDKPDMSGSGDISSIISPGDLSTSTTFLTTVVNAPYIGQVVMLSLILSLAAYVLFGKRS